MATNKIKLVVKPTRSIPMVVKPVPKIGLMSMAPTKGDPGVGIESLEQTTKSTESGGTNVWTATLTDGTVHDFEVMNGDPGEGIATGGTPGQALVKASTTDYATRWMDILPEDTASGSVASFPDGSDDLPMGVVVDIDPVQDLHGYDNPWPAGGGKNLLAMSLDNLKAVNNSGVWNGNVYTLNSVNLTVQTDSGGNVTGIAATGTASARTLFLLWTDYAYLSDMGLTDRYTLSGCPSGGGTSTYTLTLQAEGSGNISDTGASVSFDASSLTSQRYRFVVEVRANATVSNLVFKPMLRLASVSDATYSPYSNICPISGRTGAKVTRMGRNLLPTQNTVTTGNTTYIGGADYWIRLKAGTYTMSEEGAPAYLYWRKEGTTDNNIIHNNISHSGTFTLLEDCNVRFWYYGTQGTNYSSIQLETGSTAHAYEPYTAVTHEIPFSTSVYGGKLNVETGECVVTHALERITSFSGRKESNGFRTSQILSNYVGSAYTEIMCNMFQGARSYAEAMSSKKNSIGCNDRGTILLNAYVNGAYVQTISELNALIPPEGCEIWYPITPITLTLTPVEMRSLLGDNNVFADTGDVSVTYKADVQKYIDKKISAAVAAMS